MDFLKPISRQERCSPRVEVHPARRLDPSGDDILMARLHLAFAMSVVLVAPCASAEIPTPDDVLTRGQCWSEAGQSWDEQVKACSDIIDPRLFAAPSGRAQALFNRGWARIFLCEYDRAITDFQLALRIEPDAPKFREGLSEAVRRKALYAKAEQELLAGSSQIAGETNVGNFSVIPSALRDLRGAVSLVPLASAAHVRLANDLLEAKQYRAALDEFSHEMAQDGRNDRLLLGQAEARLALGDPQGAQDDLMEALQRMSSCPCGSRLLARLDRSRVTYRTQPRRVMDLTHRMEAAGVGRLAPEPGIPALQNVRKSRAPQR